MLFVSVFLSGHFVAHLIFLFTHGIFAEWLSFAVITIMLPVSLAQLAGTLARMRG